MMNSGGKTGTCPLGIALTLIPVTLSTYTAGEISDSSNLRQTSIFFLNPNLPVFHVGLESGPEPLFVAWAGLQQELSVTVTKAGEEL